MGSRHWTPEQKAAASLRMRKGKSPDRDTPSGREHFALVNHPISTQRLEAILVYEAYLNNLSLEEWLAVLRVGGRELNFPQYLPKGVSVVHKDKDVKNTAVTNLYCFPTFGDRLRWQYNDRKRGPLELPDNQEEIRELAKTFSTEVARQKLGLEKKT